MFKIESYIGPLLMSYLNKYVKLNEESFKLSLWGGDAIFHNVELQCDILEHLMLLPIGFKSGQVHELKIHIPWTKLGSESVVITLNTVECILELKSDFIKKRKSESPSETQTPEKLSPEKQRPEKNVPPGYLKSYLFNIINNIHIKVNNLIIKFVEDDIVLSMNAKALEYFPVTEQWTQGYLNFSSGNLKIHKVIEVFDLTICLDQMDSNGQIDVYQEPILYRCCVECRLFTNYQSINSNSPHFMKVNIKFGEIDINISTSQMPMLRRLIELIYALYYDIINWDSIVGCGFSKQLSMSSNISKGDLEIKQEQPLINVGNLSDDNRQSWTSWAWSYVPTIFTEEDNLLEHDQAGLAVKKSLIFGLSFQSIQFKIKKSYVSKSLFGSRRSNASKTLTHFFTIVGNNIGIHVINYGLGFFNVQLGCSEIRIFSVGNICVCGQDIPVKQENIENTHFCNLLNIGRSYVISEENSKFYLTGNLFSNNVSDEVDIFENDVSRLNTVTSSHENYKTIYSEQECINSFSALWFDYIYFMQIVKNNLDESQIDLENLCNTDGIRESSHCNLYIGQSTVVINSYFFHNLKEIMTSIDTSRYLSYIRTRTSDSDQNIFYTTEEQMARIHEFVPVREHKISLNNLSIELHTFTESHQINDEFPKLEIKTKSLNFTKSVPMYPRHLVGCVSTLNSNLLKESSELINKCCVAKLLEINGLTMSFLLPLVSYSNTPETDFIKNTLLEPCDINLNTKSLLYPETWKTTLILNEKVINVSKIKLTLIPSHVKTCIVIIASNYPWICAYFASLAPKIGSGSFYKRLDDLTLQLIGSQSSLIESCHKYFYKNKTYELHVFVPNFMFRYKETSNNRFIDAKLFQNYLSLFLCDPDTLLTIPVLDNNLNCEKSSTSNQSEICVFSCQIPNKIKPVNCIFNIKCQIGSLNIMLSQPLISWFIYPLLDLDLEKYIESDIFPVFTTAPRSSLTNKSPITNPDFRSMADGSSRPESPNIFYNKHPVPGHPKPISMNIEKSDNRNNNKIKFLSNKTGWWNMVKDSCSKYFFLLQSLDVCIKMSKSNFYISTETDSVNIQSNYKSCYEWVENYIKNAKCESSIFVIKITRLALINSQRRDYLNDNSELVSMESLPFQSRSTSIIDSLPWELVFHDIQIDCLHSLVSTPLRGFKFQEDSILKPVSINCTLSATPKCSSPDKLDSLYSVSWGIHIDITDVQPTIKQIYLSKLLKFFGDIIFGLPWSEFLKNINYLTCAHWKIFKDSFTLRYSPSEINLHRSKQSISTKSTKRSKSSIEDQASSTSKSRIVNSKLETHSITEIETEFKMSFWIQCTLSQFQLIIQNDSLNHDDSYIYIMLQIDDATSCIDVQEKFVEIKGKLGSILCQIGLMKQEKVISEIPILRMGLKFMKNSEMPYSYKSTNENSHFEDFSSDNIIRHCFSVAIIRTTPNNLSKRPISTYHQFKDNESFKSYPTEFTGNFSTAINVNNTFQSYVTQISSIIEPFDFYLPSFFLKQCLELSNSFVVLYNQLIQSSFQKWTFPPKKSAPVSASLIKNEPYFISEDMPQFFLLVKSSRIIIPRYQNDKTSIFDRQSCENGCLVLIWKKISIQPFSNNPISRPEIIEKLIDDNFTIIDSQSNFPNSLDDNRQFQLDISQCGLFLNQTFSQPTHLSPTHYNSEDLQFEWNHSTEFMSATHGQNPAFEWNNYSKLPLSMQNIKNNEIDFQPIMKPIDIQIIFAGAIHEETSKKMLKRQLIGGYGLEINISTNLEFFLDSYALDVIESITTNITGLFSENISENLIEIFDNNKRIASDICSLEDFCKSKNVESFLPSVPLNVLMTTRKINLLVLLQNSKDFHQISSCCGISISISQPHALLSFKNRDTHKLEIEFFDVNFNVTPNHWSEKIDVCNQNKPNFWHNREFFISAEMKTIMKTKPGRPDFKTGVPASLLSASLSNIYRLSESLCAINITRQVLFNIDIEDLKQIIGFIELLFSRFKVDSSSKIDMVKKSPTIPWIIFIPNAFRVSSDLFSISIYDVSDGNKFDLKFGSINISSNLIRNFEWNNLYSHTFFNCDSFSVIHSVLIDNSVVKNKFHLRFILYPFKITGKTTLSHYRFNAIEEYWKSCDWFTELNSGIINACLDDKQLSTLNKLLQKMTCIFSLKSNSLGTFSNKTNNEIDKRVEIFYDELRTNKFQLLTNLSMKENDNVSLFGSSLIADEATISFTDDNDDVASMLWTYPEPRCILSLEVKPVPFVFIECNVIKDDIYEQLQVPCRLEYWNILTNEYELYQTFNLSENQTNKMDNLPTVEQLTDQSKKLVVAKSWRVVFDCYARYFSPNDPMKSNTEKAMLVYLSPLVLAASMKIDSCYGSFLGRNSFLKLSIPQFQLTFLEDKRIVLESDISKPYRSINQIYTDYSLSDNNILFKFICADLYFKDIVNEMIQFNVSKTELFLSDPFLALQLPISIIDNFELKHYQSQMENEPSSMQIEACQIGFDTISLKQLYVTIEKMKNLISCDSLNSNFLHQPMLMICNNLDRRIRIKQKEDNFLKFSDSSKIAGLGSGEAVVLKLFPSSPNVNREDIDKSIEKNRVEIIIGLCSELNGTIRWTNSVAMPLLGLNDTSTSFSNFGIFKLENSSKSDLGIINNSSIISNSFNAKNVFFLHNQFKGGLNKVMIFGNTIISNVTNHYLHINFSLPSEIASGVSFNVPSHSDSAPVSQYINWRIMSFSALKNIFELSFRIMNDSPINSEYRSASYQIDVPKLSDVAKFYHQQQMIIKLKLNKADCQITSNDSLHNQFLCTLEWFKYFEGDELFLLVTVSPLVIFENQMLCDINLEISQLKSENTAKLSMNDKFIVEGKGGILKLMNLFSSGDVKLNAAFVNDAKMILDKPIELSEKFVIESLSKKLKLAHGKFDSLEESDKINYIANLINQVVENKQHVLNHQFHHNLYSFNVTITPWILIFNKSQLNLVLSFDKNVYFLESNSKFVPSKSNKLMKIGIMYDDDVYWSREFSVGRNATKQDENSINDVTWSFDNNEEAFLQLKIIVGKHKYLIPLTLRHTFIKSESKDEDQNSNKFPNLIIESSIFVSNRTDLNLGVEALYIAPHLVSYLEDSSVCLDRLPLNPQSGYLSIDKFCSFNIGNDDKNENKLILNINLSNAKRNKTISFNSIILVDMNIFSARLESEMILETKFIFVKNNNEESKKIDFNAFTVNSTVNLNSKKVFVDIYECKYVPIIITNLSNETVFFDELSDENFLNSVNVQIEPSQSIPFWPVDFQVNFNKEGYGDFSKPFNRFRLGFETGKDFSWTEYFPLANMDLPSNMNISTIDNRKNVDIILESDECVKLHLKIIDKLHSIDQFPRKDLDLPVKRLMICRLSLSLLERESDMETLVESVRMSIRNLNCILSSKGKNTLYEISANQLQIDNKSYSSGLYDFPVFLNSIETNPGESFFIIQIEINSYSTYALDVRFHNEVELFIENIFLYDLLRLFSKFYQIQFWETADPTNSVLSLPPISVIRVSISPIMLRMTVHAFLKIYVSCEATSLTLPEFTVKNCCFRISALQKRLWQHYVTAVLVRCGCVLGSIELFGNPSGIIRHLTTGLTGLVSIRNIDHGLLVDFLLRLLSFCRHTSGGFISSFTGIASSVSRNLDYFTLDDTHISRQDLLRRQNISQGVMHGFMSGLSGLALSFLGAIAGLADQPLQASQEALNANSSVSIAVIKGLGKGFIGVVTKPLSGTAELLAQTGRGLLNSTGISKNRCHSNLVNFTLTSSNLEIFINAEQFIHLSMSEKYEKEINMPILYWSGVAINDDDIPVYLFLTNCYLVEWYIDKPLNNKKTLYDLSNYNFYVTSHSTYKNCLVLKYTSNVNNLNMQSDNRIKAFISDLYYTKELESNQNGSRASSMDSTEYVKFVSVSITGTNQNNGEHNPTLSHSDQKIFYSNHLFGGIIDALSFLGNLQDHFDGFIH